MVLEAAISFTSGLALLDGFVGAAAGFFEDTDAATGFFEDADTAGADFLGDANTPFAGLDLLGPSQKTAAGLDKLDVPKTGSSFVGTCFFSSFSTGACDRADTAFLVDTDAAFLVDTDAADDFGGAFEDSVARRFAAPTHHTHCTAAKRLATHPQGVDKRRL